MMQLVESIFDIPAVTKFAEAAQVYCELVENAASADKHNFFERCFRLVSGLISLAIELPEIDGAPEDRAITHDSYAEIVRRIQVQTGNREYYRMVFAPWGPDSEELMYGSISDDLADIWRDLRNGLISLESGNLNNAIWFWRFNFLYHWGPHHATQVLRPLFSLVFDEFPESA
jgi:hypothetical protein